MPNTLSCLLYMPEAGIVSDAFRDAEPLGYGGESVPNPAALFLFSAHEGKSEAEDDVGERNG